MCTKTDNLLFPGKFPYSHAMIRCNANVCRRSLLSCADDFAPDVIDELANANLSMQSRYVSLTYKQYNLYLGTKRITFNLITFGQCVIADFEGFGRLDPLEFITRLLNSEKAHH